MIKLNPDTEKYGVVKTRPVSEFEMYCSRDFVPETWYRGETDRSILAAFAITEISQRMQRIGPVLNSNGELIP